MTAAEKRIISACLSFLDRELDLNPQAIGPFLEENFARLEQLVKGVIVSDDEIIPDDISL